MEEIFFGIDENNNTSANAEGESEAFASFDKAVARAKALAACEPGQQVIIARAVAFALVPLGKVAVTQIV